MIDQMMMISWNILPNKNKNVKVKMQSIKGITITPPPGGLQIKNTTNGKGSKCHRSTTEETDPVTADCACARSDPIQMQNQAGSGITESRQERQIVFFSIWSPRIQITN